MTPSDLTGATKQPTRRLAGKFSDFRRRLRLDEMPETSALMLQGAYIAGAQAAFQVLSEASKETPEDAIVIWGELQNEILNAIPKAPVVQAMPEKRLII